MLTILKRTLYITAITFLIPIVLGLVYKFGAFGSIGPLVLFYSLGSLLLFVTIYVELFLYRYKVWLSVLLGIIVGLVLSTLLLNYFMMLTFLIGIKDYDAM